MLARREVCVCVRGGGGGHVIWAGVRLVILESIKLAKGIDVT